jgi:Tfp pilus assembly protein PilZ/CheY-like chemotaxis protein
MKRLLLADHREELLATLEVILRHWGYRVVASSRPENLDELLRETAPDLLIVGARMAADPRLAGALAREVTQRQRPLIILKSPDVPATPPLPHESLGVPVDLFALFRLMQQHLEKHPRRHLRLAVRLPGLLCAGESCHLAEILSLSSEGLFLRTCFRLGDDTRLKVVLPLLGMKQEVELDGRVLYRVEPTAENNYLQGVGIEFTDLSDEARRQLRSFLKHRFLGDLADRPEGQHLGGDDEVILRLSE